MDTAEHRPFGAVLRGYRVAAGLSQEELAARAHLSRRTISDLERGATSAPYRSTVALLADALALDAPQRAALDRAARGTAPVAAQQRADPGVDALLTTKLAIPAARPALVPRPRLIERLSAGLQGPLTLLSAPAGSGKTTLISAWRTTPEGQARPLAWVSLDAGDNDPTRFWRYVLSALERVAPGVGTAALALLHSVPPPTGETILTPLLNALSIASEDIVLVLDDYHLIAAEPLHRALAFLLEHAPPTLHLLLATRADPPLPLARLRARGLVTELRAADLRFTAEETAAFLGTVMCLSLSMADVVALETRTEGWIAGLQLVALSLQGRPAEDAAPFIARFTGSHRYIVDYLIDEVLLRQPEAVQTFLLHTCILERLCAPLCAGVIDDEDLSSESIAASQEMLESLERNNVFLIALDDERRWYRYHHLFADAVRQRQIVSALVPDAALLHQRASVWLEREGLLYEAVGHALAAGAHEHAADLITRVAPAMFSRGEFETIAIWLEALPDAALRARPRLSVVRAWFLLDRRDADGAAQYLRQAETALDAYEAADARDLRGEIAAAWANTWALRGDAPQVMTHAQAAFEDLDDTRVAVRSLATMSLGFAQLTRGAAHEAAVAFRAAAAGNRGTNNAYLMLLASLGQAYAHRAAGAMGLSARTCAQAMRWSEERSHPAPLVGTLYAGLADILREQNQLESALEHVTRGISLAARPDGRAGRWLEWQLFGALVLARIKQAQGDLDGALAVVSEARERLRGVPTAPFTALFAAFEAQIHLAQGNLDAALQWSCSVDAQGAPPRLGGSPQFFVYAYEHIAIAPIQVLIAQRRASAAPTPLQRAHALLAQQREQAERLALPWLRMKSLALQALTYHALGEVAPALAALEQALALAQPEGYVRLFADEGAPMAALLRQVQARGATPAYTGRLLAALGSDEDVQSTPQASHDAAPTGSRGPSPLPEPLTARERAVLRLLAAGHSNPAIARALYVEVNTVKTHLKGLYGKLAVHTREQAVARAREMRLL